MTDFLIFWLAVYGLTFTVVTSHLPLWAKLRDKLKKHDFFDKLLGCSFCAGFWSSLVICWFVFPEVVLTPQHVVYGFAGATLAFLTDIFADALLALGDA